MRAKIRGLERKHKRTALALSGVSLTLSAPALAWAPAQPGRTMGRDAQSYQTDLSGPVAHALVTSASWDRGCSTLPAAVTVPTSAGRQRLVWVARRRWVRCR